MKVYEVVEDHDECQVTLYRSLDKKKCESIVKQMPPHGYAEVVEYELDTFTFGKKMYKIDYQVKPFGSTEFSIDSTEINYKPTCGMCDVKSSYRLVKVTEVIPK